MRVDTESDTHVYDYMKVTINRDENRFADAYGDSIEAVLKKEIAQSNGGMVIGLVDEHGSRIFGAGQLVAP